MTHDPSNRNIRALAGILLAEVHKLKRRELVIAALTLAAVKGNLTPEEVLHQARELDLIPRWVPVYFDIREVPPLVRVLYHMSANVDSSVDSEVHRWWRRTIKPTVTPVTKLLES